MKATVYPIKKKKKLVQVNVLSVTEYLFISQIFFSQCARVPHL